MYDQPVSPLKHPLETVDKLLFCADRGILSTYCPSPIAGGTAPITDAQVIDARAGMEADEPTKLSMQLGSYLNHDCGYLDVGLTGSLEEPVMVAEVIACNRRLLAAIAVSPETLAVDVLVKVGPGGDFLGQKHTSRHLRDSQWRPALLNRMSHERWLESGGLDLTEKSRQKARELIATHQMPVLPDDLVARSEAVVAGL